MPMENANTMTAKEAAEYYGNMAHNDPELYLEKLYAGEIQTGYPAIDRPWYKFFPDKYTLSKVEDQMTIFDYVRSHPERTNGHTALSYYGHEISYDEMFKHVEECMKVLADMGVQKGDRILCMVPNVPETAYLYFAVAQLGAISDYVDPRPDSPDPLVAARKMLSLFVDEKCKYVITMDMCYLGMIAPNEQEWKDAGLEKILMFSPADSMTLKSKMTYAKWGKLINGKEAFNAKLEKQKEMGKLLDGCLAKSILDIRMLKDEVKRCKNHELPVVDVDPQDLCVITHTSGSTGRPKPLPFTHYNLVVAGEEIARNEDFNWKKGSECTRSMHALPFFAAYGVGNVFMGAMGRGITMVEIPEIGSNDFGKLVYLNKVTMCAVIPSWVLSMLDDPYLENKDLSFLDWISVGGTGMTAKEVQAVNKFVKDHGANFEIVQGYGMSETCGAVSQAVGEYNIPGTIGVPYGYRTYGVIDPETKEMKRFEDGMDEISGELVICAGAASPGSLDGVDYVPFAEYFGDTYVLSGDTVFLNRDGIVHFAARNDRGFARYDGFNVKPGKLEEVISDFDEVRACAITPFEDAEKNGKQVLANVVLAPKYQGMTMDEMVQLVCKIVDEGFIQNEDLSARQIPVKFKFREEFPLTGIGKTNFKAMAREGITGDEISVVVEDTNVSLGSITVVAPDGKKTVAKAG